jgi:hypothetical protein
MLSSVLKDGVISAACPKRSIPSTLPQPSHHPSCVYYKFTVLSLGEAVMVFLSIPFTLPQT